MDGTIHYLGKIAGAGSWSWIFDRNDLEILAPDESPAAGDTRPPGPGEAGGGGASD